MAIHDKEYTLYKISSGKPLKKLTIATKNKKTLGWSRIKLPRMPYYNIQNVQFLSKDYEACKETRKYDLETD